MKAAAPRVIFIRHGQTEWSKSGQHTSITDIPLTEFGVKQMKRTGEVLLKDGPTQSIKPQNLKHVFTSPRRRAKQTVELVLGPLSEEQKSQIPITEVNDLREWDYGDYEGLLKSQILDLRKSRGLDKDLPSGETWQIWRDGCENGENHLQVQARVDKAIALIRTIHKKALDEDVDCDVLVVAHGHILRCFAARWVNRPINIDPQFMLDAGGVGVLSYQHHNIEEPAVFLAGAFVVPVCEESDDL